MKIVLNGEPFEVEAPVTVSGLLAVLGFDPRIVAVEVNEQVVKRTLFDETVIHEGDRVEIVHIVGGGAPERDGTERPSSGRSDPEARDAGPQFHGRWGGGPPFSRPPVRAHNFR